MERIVVPTFENIDAIIFHFSERPVLAMFPDMGVEMPHRGRVSCLACFPCFLE
jgi:hypothetical protein